MTKHDVIELLDLMHDLSLQAGKYSERYELDEENEHKYCWDVVFEPVYQKLQIMERQ